MGVALFLPEKFEERLGTGMGDGAQVLHEFLAGHAEAGVRNRDGLGFGIGFHLDL